MRTIGLPVLSVLSCSVCVLLGDEIHKKSSENMRFIGDQIKILQHQDAAGTVCATVRISPRLDFEPELGLGFTMTAPDGGVVFSSVLNVSLSPNDNTTWISEFELDPKAMSRIRLDLTVRLPENPYGLVVITFKQDAEGKWLPVLTLKE